MPRPGFVLDVDDATPPVLFWRNGQLTTEKLPENSRVVYPPEPLTPLVDVRANVRHMLSNPTDGEPLQARMRSGMRLTVAFDDLTATDRPLASPDPRGIALEEVLTIVAEAGIDDVQLVNARGLGRRMTKAELAAMLGERITDSFVVTPDLIQHDADEDDQLTLISNDSDAEPIRINKRIADSDLLIYVTVDPTDAAPYRNIACRITDAGTIRHVTSSSDNATIDRIGRTIEEQTPVFQIALNLNNAQFAGTSAFLQHRAPEATALDRAAFSALKGVLDLTPAAVRTRLLQVPPSRQEIIGVFAGSVSATHAAGQNVFARQYGSEPLEPTDVAVIGAPPASPFAINSILNPLLAAHTALTTVVPHDGSPSFVRQGGALVIHHGLTKRFDPQQQTAFIDFFDDVLPVEAKDLVKREEAFANDAWYAHLYRTSYSHHGTLPFRLWAECARARDHLAGIVVVGGDTRAAHRLGFRRASTFADAIEMARDITSTARPSVTHVPYPAPRAQAVK
jgi:hypothetical protein